MSEFSELIKRFDKIRDYMREFYVYGFKSRKDFDRKSLRSYDNEKRRIESYLSNYMSFKQDENGKYVFLSVDSSEIPANPLYRAFKTKSFTKNDILLNFIILDILYSGEALSTNEIADKLSNEYLACFEEPAILDLSTVRNKLSEYDRLGILTAEKQGRKLLYSLSTTDINLGNLCDALIFFSEVSPLGIVGSYLLDKCKYNNYIFSFKHHYIMHALESEIVYDLLEAIHNKKIVNISNQSIRFNRVVSLEIVPLRFLNSLQGGRRYLSAYSFKSKAILNFRLDYIKEVSIIGESQNFDNYVKTLDRILLHTWGASFRNGRNLERLSMTLNIPNNERFIINRIEREGRNGTLSKINDTTYIYMIEVYDSMEMLPWIRTFIGRIILLECDNMAVVDTFYKDLDELYAIYGICEEGEDNVV